MLAGEDSGDDWHWVTAIAQFILLLDEASQLTIEIGVQFRIPSR